MYALLRSASAITTSTSHPVLDINAFCFASDHKMQADDSALPSSLQLLKAAGNSHAHSLQVLSSYKDSVKKVWLHEAQNLYLAGQTFWYNW
jgi:hypothetical protein